MKLRLVAVVTALVTLPALVHAQGGPPSNAPKPTKADAQKVVQIISNDKAKTQAYCDLNKVYDSLICARPYASRWKQQKHAAGLLTTMLIYAKNL